MQPIIDFISTSSYIIAAHRGASGLFKENTLLAYEKAIEMEANMIELDIRFTKDLQIVCFHNALIDKIEISNTNYIDLCCYSIPLLDDILRKFADKVYFIIEVKDIGSNYINNMRSLIDLIKKIGLLDSVAIASEQISILSYVKNKLEHSLNTALIYNKKNINTNKKYYDGIICSIKELEEVVNTKIFNSNFIGVYGINSLDDVKKCLKYNIRLFGTDYPAEIRKHLEELYV